MATELIPVTSASGPGQPLNMGSKGEIQVTPGLTASKNNRK